MKIASHISSKGSVLIIALLTITIMTLICATSLLVTSQTSNAGMQTASWQQSLTAAETGVDAAIRALNENGQTGAWTNWLSISQSGTSLPTVEPTPSSPTAATSAPDSTHYNLLPSSSPSPGPLYINFPTTEGATSVKAWVTIDTAGMSTSQDTNNKQWYRVRSTGIANTAGPARVSNNRLDDDLRNTLALNFNRKGATTLGPTRTIEVILSPLAGGGWARGITMGKGLSMSGSGSIDSFDSSAVGGNHQWALAYRRDHGDVGIANNTTNSDVRNTYVYGQLAYSGTVVKNTTNVSSVVSPGPTAAASTKDPTTLTWWQSDDFQTSQPYYQTSGGVPSNYTNYAGGGNPPTTSPLLTFTASGSAGSPTMIKVTGDFTVPGGKVFNVVKSNNGVGSGSDTWITVWITGKFVTSGSGYIVQAPGVHVTWIVDGDITVSGDSYQNQTGYAANNSFIGVGSNKFTDSGSSTFTGTVYAPGYDETISGSGDFSGGMVGNTLTISGGASLHYDEALGGGGGNTSVGAFAFASWFEDNSTYFTNPNTGVTTYRKDASLNPIIY